jgi:hypothetical protein
MRATLLISAVLTLGIVGCDYNGSGPSTFRNTYALARIGTKPLPAPLDGANSPTLVVADTLRLLVDKARDDQPFLQQVSVFQEGTGPKTKSQHEYFYTVTGSFLTYDQCPIGTFCIASLVASARTFQIAGDSLFEVVQEGVARPPYVYGRISVR